MGFFTGLIIGAVVIMLLPPKYEDWLRQWIISMWQKVTNQG